MLIHFAVVLGKVVAVNMTAIDVLEYVRENDVKFIRLAFSDILGTLKNISIMPSEVECAFEQGILFDASAVKGVTAMETKPAGL